MSAPDARALVSTRRWRNLFVVLALVVPTLLFGLFRRQELRLRALADHGQTIEATLTHHSRQDSSVYSHYEYRVGGRSYRWSVSYDDAPYGEGESFPVTFLPEAPGFSRPFVPFSAEHLEEELNLPLRRGLPLAALAFFGGVALLCQRGVRRLRQGRPPARGLSVSPDVAGRWLAVLILALLLSVEFDADVQAVHVALMGPAPGGIPAPLVAAAVQVLLYLPYFWVFPHLMRILIAARERGSSLSRFNVIQEIVRVPPVLRRSRAIVLAGVAYFAVLLALWIALTESRGV